MSNKVRILINGITFDDANHVPLIQKIRYWKKQGMEIVLIGTKHLANKIGKDLIDFHIVIKGKPPVGGKFSFIKYAITRNLLVLQKWSQIENIDVVYSISSVLDLIILPFLLKKSNKVKKWGTVFDNTVPLFSGGKLISGGLSTRILAWTFYQISLFLLRSADFVFVVKPELKKYLSKRGFKSDHLIVTGNGVQNDLILKAKYRKKYNYDALFIGRINEAKGIYDLLAVLEIVKKEYPHFQLGIMGRGDAVTEKKYKNKIKESKLSANVHLLGFKTGQEKFDIIRSSKMFLFLSQTESVPIAPLEAVCSGKIALVYDLDAYKMYKNHEVTKFKQGDFRSVASRVSEIIKSGVYLNQSGAMLLDRFSWDIIAKKEVIRFLRHGST